MRNFVISIIIGLAISANFTGCGSKTPKEQVYDMTYEALSEGDQKLTPEKAKCIAEKVAVKLSNEDIDNLLKAKKLKDDGYESEIATSPKLIVSGNTYMRHIGSAIDECQK